MCFVYDYEQATISNVEFRKCRKAAGCVVCRQMIKPGDQYQYFSYLIQGDFLHFCRTMSDEQTLQHQGLIHVAHFHLLQQVLF